MKNPLPKMFHIRQRLYGARVNDLSAAVAQALADSGALRRIGPGDRIAITAGSRGIAEIDAILRGVVEEVCQAGGQPFLFPAMGSHGGGAAAGQLAILQSLNVTEDRMDAPLRATMATEVLGETREGLPTHVDQFAAGAEGILVVNRVKRHTNFFGAIESGLSKMVAVGLGKRHGAATVHSRGLAGLKKTMPEIASVLLQRARILGCLAVLENGYHQVAQVVGVPTAEVPRVEPLLLTRAKRTAPGLPFNPLDVLIVERLGKDISGTGMDTKVVGRIRIPGFPEPRQPHITRIVALDLTPASHGNGNGVGLADFVTQQLAQKIDWSVTEVNAVTAGFFERAKLPFVLPTEEEAVRHALDAARVSDPAQARIVRLRDTLHLGEMLISEALVEEAARMRHVEVLGEADGPGLEALGPPGL